MRFRKHTFAWLAIAGMAVAFGMYLLLPPPPAAQLPTKWTPHPDSFPLGTILAGSTIEMSVALHSDSKPPPLPTWVSKLPRLLRGVVESIIHKHRARAYRRAWRVQANLPDFLCLDRVEMDYHPIHGPFPTLTLRLTNAAPGSYSERILVELIYGHSQTSAVAIPVNATVLPGIAKWKVLLTESPFEKYATDSGKSFEPLAEITSRLAKRGVRVDFLRELPRSLKDYDVVLVSETPLVQGLNQANFTNQLHQFVARGGRLIVAADGFFVGTVEAANKLVKSYGLEMDPKEAPKLEARTLKVVADPFTSGVSELKFWRGSYLWSTDNRQAKVISLQDGNAEIGFVGVSRATGRGDVVLWSQSLWWNGLSAGPDGGDNAKMFENLLAP